MEWEKIFANYMSSKRLVYNKLIKVNDKKKKTQQLPNNISRKWAKDLNRHFSKRRHTDGQQVHEKVLSITNHQGNANQNHDEISLYTY